MRRTHAAARWALVLSVIGTDDALAAQGFAKTDSAGVTIATSTAPEWVSGEGWTRRWPSRPPVGGCPSPERHVADVAMPGALRAFAITEDGVLGSTRGEYDEERIELWPFEERLAESADVLSACAPSER